MWIDVLFVRRLLIFTISLKKQNLIEYSKLIAIIYFQGLIHTILHFCGFNIDEQLSHTILVCFTLFWITILTFHTFVLFLWFVFWLDFFLWSNFVVINVVSHFKHFYLVFLISHFVCWVSLNFTRVYPYCYLSQPFYL